MAQSPLQVPAHSNGYDQRTGFNSAILALASQFAGPTDPSTMTPSCAFPYMLWPDTGNMLLKQRTSDNTAWVPIGVINADGTFSFNASKIANIPAGNVTSTNVQDAINELDTEKLPMGSPAAGLGTKLIDETAITDGALLGFDAASGKIKYKSISGGVPGLPDYIASGRDITPGTGLQVNIATGIDYINGKTLNMTGVTVTLDPRMAALIYDVADGSTDKVNAQLPAPDANSIVFYDFTNFDGSSPIPNSAVGVNGNTIAVANPSTKSGTVSKVDGWCGQAAQGDGISGYLASANSTGFPTGVAERRMDFAFTVNTTLSGIRRLSNYGSGDGTNNHFFGIGFNGMRLKPYLEGTDYDSNFDVEVGKTYYGRLIYTGTQAVLYINGSEVYRVTVTLNTGAGLLYLLKNPLSAAEYCPVTLHYVEIGNKAGTPAQIGSISNKLCLPCSYTAPQASYPTISASDLASAYHEYKFDETSGTSVADSNTTTPLTGTATGTTIVDSAIGLGKARKSSVNTDIITCGSYVWPSTAFTVIALVDITSFTPGTSQAIASNWNGASNGVSIGFGASGNQLWVWNDNTSYSIPNTQVSVSGLNFIAVTFSNGILNGYTNSPMISGSIAGPASMSAISNTLKLLNNASGSNNFLNGKGEYIAIIPRALSQSEIAPIYNALMKQSKKDIREILPINAISRGFARTDSTKVIEYNQDDYRYGVRYADKRNKVITTPWKYASGVGTWQFDNPFGTDNVKYDLFYKKNLTDTIRQRITTYYVGSGHDGIHSYISPFKFTAKDSFGSKVYVNESYTGSTENSGYLAFVAEVIE